MKRLILFFIIFHICSIYSSQIKIEFTNSDKTSTYENIINQGGKFKNDTIYIELASFPGGIDKHYAKSKNINIIVASKLPSRYSKETAGYLIGEAIDKMIKEGKVWKSVIA